MPTSVRSIAVRSSTFKALVHLVAREKRKSRTVGDAVGAVVRKSSAYDFAEIVDIVC
jgi:uncharacterized membrane protein